MQETPKRRPPLIRWAAYFVLIFGILIGSAVLRHPDTPVPPHWNVFEPLSVAAPVTPLTGWKLDWAESDPALCLRVLQEAGRARAMPDLSVSDSCGIAPRFDLAAVGSARLDPVETTCAVALRLALWEQHGLQPAAREILGSPVAVIRHVGSYNCRRIRGSSNRWSTHATAEAIDVTGFDLADGTRVRLLRDWSGDGPKAQFLRRVRDASCQWFETTLGPDYNRLHADHFHLQSRGWGTCR